MVFWLCASLEKSENSLKFKPAAAPVTTRCESGGSGNSRTWLYQTKKESYKLKELPHATAMSPLSRNRICLLLGRPPPLSTTTQVVAFLSLFCLGQMMQTMHDNMLSQFYKVVRQGRMTEQFTPKVLYITKAIGSEHSNDSPSTRLWAQSQSECCNTCHCNRSQATLCHQHTTSADSMVSMYHHTTTAAVTTWSRHLLGRVGGRSGEVAVCLLNACLWGKWWHCIDLLPVHYHTLSCT